jgi:hypothetical protein
MPDGFYSEPPKLAYEPQYKDDHTEVSASLNLTVYDASATDTVDLTSSESPLDTADFNWTKERDVQILADLKPLAEIDVSDGTYTSTIDAEGKITNDAAGDYTTQMFLDLDSIACQSLKNIKIVNRFDVNILVQHMNSSDAILGQRILQPGQTYIISGSQIQNVERVRIFIYDKDVEEIDSSIVVSTAATTDYCTFNGGVSVLFDNKTGLSIAMLALVGGAAIGGQILKVEAILPILKPLTGTFGQIAKTVGSTASDLMIGYGAAFLGAVSLGWLDFTDIVDMNLHVELITGIARNPAALISGVASLGAGFLPGLLGQGLSVGASMGVALAVLGYLESIKQYYYPETYA